MNETVYLYISVIFDALLVLFALVGSIAAYVQLRQIKKNRQRQFDQSRREKTVEMVTFYVQNTTRGTRAVEKIVSSFSDDQCLELYNGTPFCVDEKIKNDICQVCPHKKECESITDPNEKKCKLEKDGAYIVDGTVLHFIRSHIISYLNNLETVLLAWQLAIVDQSIIEEQFAFLDKKRQRERALETFRTIAGGGKSYPAIEKFYQHLTQKRIEEAKETLKKILD